MKTVDFRPSDRVTNVLVKVKDDVLEQEFERAIGYKAQRAFYTTYYINPSFIKKYAKKLDWGMLCRNQPLSSSLIDKNANYVDWESVSECQQLSGKILLKHRDKIVWFEASQHQTLSEDVMRKLKDYIDWEFASGTQKMSMEFMLEMRKHIKKKWLPNNSHLTSSDIDTYKILCKLT
jgi:hypothetical protein